MSFVALGVLWREPRLRPRRRHPAAPVGCRRCSTRGSARGRRGPDAGPDRLDPDLAGPRPGRRQQPGAVRRLRVALGRAAASRSCSGPVWSVAQPDPLAAPGHHRASRGSTRTARSPTGPPATGRPRSGCSPSPGSSWSRPTGRRCRCCASRSAPTCCVNLMGALVLGTRVVPPGGRVRGAGRGSTARSAPSAAAPTVAGAAHAAARPQRAPGRAGPAGDGRGDAGRHGVRRVLRRAALVHLGAVLGAACAAAADRRAAAHVRRGGRCCCGWPRRSAPGWPGCPPAAWPASSRPRCVPIAAGYLVAHYWSLLGLRGAEHPDPAQRPARHRRRPARHRAPDPRRDPDPAHPRRHDPGGGDRHRPRARRRPRARAAP